MSLSEAGKRGGETTSQKYGPDFYSEIGRLGGQARRGTTNRGGSSGGRSRGGGGRGGRDESDNESDVSSGRSEAGRKGGEATAATHDREFFREIGKMGAEARWGKRSGGGRSSSRSGGFRSKRGRSSNE
jgi:general stress protein YciG